MRSESPSISTRSIAEPAAGYRPPAAAFRLDGPTRRLDARTNAYRADIADIELAGTLFAPHYAAPILRSASTATMMRAVPDDAGVAVSQLLPGEGFAVLDLAGGWAWGYSLHDHYVGYVSAAALGEPGGPTHRIAVREALIFAGPSIKSAALGTLPYGARIAGELDDAFLRMEDGFVHRRHIEPLDARATDPVAIAELFLGAPYLWGGRGAGGVDCSGLVQIALAAAGVPVPRDSDLQRASIGQELAKDDALRRGDIIFFPGHVGLMADDTHLLHANAHWMGVVIEPLADVVARLAPHHDRPISGRRRISS